MLVRSNFSFSLSVFNPIKELGAIFIKFEIVVCKLFQLKNLTFGKGLIQIQLRIYLVIHDLDGIW